MVRLKDIALRAGCSVMTVSKVLRNAPDISPATKARIKQMAEQMGYVPDSLAQGLRTRSTRTVGLVIPTVTNPLYARDIVDVEEQAYELGYEVILAHSLNDPAREDAVIRRLLSRRVDGLIISPVYRLAPTAPVYQELSERGTSVVIWGQTAPFCASFPSVETEDIDGAYSATQHLIGLGHRRIAFLAGPSVAPWNNERLEGYKRALREAGIDMDEKLVFSAGSNIEDGKKAALQMLDEGIKPTALQACNDMVAIGAASVLMQQGWKIPHDISIVGFGDILLCEHFCIPLTTVHQPKFRIGETAMETMRLLLKHQPVDSKRLPTHLVIRESTSEPAS